jgi:hypothetical protein
MNIIENAQEAKKQIIDAFEEWVLSIVDEFVASNPKMTVAGVYVKNGIRNYRKKKECEIGEMLDDAALFIADEKGEVNVNKVFADLNQFMKDADNVHVDLGFTDLIIDKGSLKINIPNNWFTNMIFGSGNALVIKESDISNLKMLMCA